jgi:DUF971 family protein
LWIDWDGAGDASHFPARALRIACPCAACVDEISGRRMLDPASIPETIAPVAIELVGGYGLRVRWNDGHSTGIYTFAWFRRGLP